MSIKTTARIITLSLLFGTATHPVCSGRTRLRKNHTEAADTKLAGFTPVLRSTDPSPPALADVDVVTCAADQKIVPDDGENWDEFGWSLDVDGDFLIVGAPLGGIVDAGKAYIYRRDDDQWSEPSKLVANDPERWDDFGSCVAISGDTSLVGARFDNDGSVHVFVHNNTNNTWSLETILTASGSLGFGDSCALDGNTAIVGAPWTDNDKGSAYVFERDEANGWSGPQELVASDAREEGDEFGLSTAIRGDMAIVGAYFDDNGRGAAYIFVRDATSNTWAEEAKLTASDGRDGDWFGWSVAIDEDVAIVGAPFTESDGAVYVFVRGQNEWGEARRVTGQDVGAAGNFGRAVAIDGDNVVVGASAPRNTAYLFSIGDDGELTLVAELVAEEAWSESRFGWRGLGISGTIIAVGAYLDKNDDGVQTGSAYAFESCASGPTPGASVPPSSRPSPRPIPSSDTAEPSTRPSPFASVVPSMRPSVPTSPSPSSVPSIGPTDWPSVHPSSRPSVPTSAWPSAEPSDGPTAGPSVHPSLRPSVPTTRSPSSVPSDSPTVPASSKPSPRKGSGGTLVTERPSVLPSSHPSAPPTAVPTPVPTTSEPTTREPTTREPTTRESTATSKSSKSTKSKGSKSMWSKSKANKAKASRKSKARKSRRLSAGNGSVGCEANMTGTKWLSWVARRLEGRRRVGIE